jgi:phosphate transport system substrate-binding protein
MKKNIHIIVAGMVTAILLLTGCTNTTAEIVVPTDGLFVGRLTFAGSTTVQPLAKLLGDEFIAQNPQVTLEIAAGGSGVGIQAIHDGAVDIGMASRSLKENESQGIEEFQIAVDVIAIIVNPANPVHNLTLSQLQRIYLGEITNWDELGGDDLEIVPIIREESSGTRGAFDELVLGHEAPGAPNLQIAITAGDVAAAVAKTPGAVGYVGFGNFEDDIKLLSIDGVQPSSDAARDGSYPITRPLLFLTGPLSQPLAADFVDFVCSPDGQALVEIFGWIPVKDVY